MGWWGSGVLDGDHPLDMLGVYAAICSAPYRGRECSPDSLGGFDFTREILEEKTPLLIARALRDSQDHVAWQVLGMLLMHYGAPMSVDLVNTCMNACDRDEWACEEGGDRRKKMDALQAQLCDYVGEPTPKRPTAVEADDKDVREWLRVMDTLEGRKALAQILVKLVALKRL